LNIYEGLYNNHGSGLIYGQINPSTKISNKLNELCSTVEKDRRRERGRRKAVAELRRNVL